MRALKPFGDYSPPVSDEIAKQKTITLWFPRVEFTGGSAAGYDLDITGWRGSIAMYVEADGVAEETSLEIGLLELFTRPLNASTAESLDGVSADTAAYLELLSQDDVSDEVNEQFDYPIVSGLVILDRAYAHPTLRGHDIGAWAAVQAVHDLMFGSSVLVAAYPRPTEPRRGQTTQRGAQSLGQYWAKAGLDRIEACPKLIGQTTDGPAFSNARSELAGIAELQLSVAVNDLTRP